MTQSPNPQLNDADLELLSAYIDSQLTSAARAACEERLRHEPALRVALDELRATIVLLHELEPAKPPRSFALDPQAYAPRRMPLFARLNLGSALTAVALAFIFLAVFVVRGLQPGGGPTASAPAPAAVSGGSQAFTMEATAQAESSNRSSAATAAALPDVAMAEAPTAAASLGQATAAPASADSQAAGATGPAATAASAPAATAAQPLLAQQPSDTPLPSGESYPPPQEPIAPIITPAQQPSDTPLPQESIPPIATSGSTSPGTSYLPPQPVTPGIAVQTPISIVIGVLLLLIVGLLWWTRRRRR